MAWVRTDSLSSWRRQSQVRKILGETIRFRWNEVYLVPGLGTPPHSDQTSSQAAQADINRRCCGEAFVLVKSIGNGEFNRLLPSHLVLEDLMAGQVEWFGNKPRNLIGTIAEGRGQAGWNYAILRRSKVGDFCVSDVRANFHSYKAARADFLLAVAGVRTSRQSDVPRMNGR